MIRIHITDEDNNVLGHVTLDLTDITPRTDNLDAKWIGQQILDELPSDKSALLKLLANKEV
jgi:hypothetical protein